MTSLARRVRAILAPVRARSVPVRAIVTPVSGVAGIALAAAICLDRSLRW